MDKRKYDINGNYYEIISALESEIKENPDKPVYLYYTYSGVEIKAPVSKVIDWDFDVYYLIISNLDYTGANAYTVTSLHDNLKRFIQSGIASVSAEIHCNIQTGKDITPKKLISSDILRFIEVNDDELLIRY